ncbi:putative bifunctional diguanylate cyclase/phosphodiesterase, partial [Pseudomonadota bacterium]
LEQTILNLGHILDHSWNEVYIFRADTFHFIEVSEIARQNLGYSVDELKQLTLLDLEPEFTHDQFEALINPLRQDSDAQIVFEATQQRKDGTQYPVEVRLHLFNQETPPVFVAIIQDISVRMHYISELKHKALYDTLTELPNRSLLQERLKQALKIARREASQLAVITIDIIRLGDINNLMGYQNGDLILREVGSRLQKALRESDTVAHLGSDEFSIILPAVDITHIHVAAEKMGRLFEQPILIEDTPLEIEVAIGIALYPDHGDTPTTLLRHADIAMRLAKYETTAYSIYNPEDDPSSLLRLKLHGELRQAINEEMLTLYYQPKINIKTGRITSVEALARWPHPTNGMISPIEFIPMIEQSGMIQPFTFWVLEQAIEQSKLWAQSGINLTIAINLSARNLLDPGLPGHIGKLLESHKISPACLSVEITESAIMSRPKNALKTLFELNEMGIKISIDDFGTGYSSLTYLKEMPVHELKIDQSFIFGLTANSKDSVIVRSTIDLAHNLGLLVVAEGVENQDTLEYLATLNCDIAQGYHISDPMPGHKLEHWLMNSIWDQQISTSSI